MKKLLVLLLVVIILFVSVPTVSAESSDVLPPDKYVELKFKEFYAEKTGGETPYNIYCYKLNDLPADDDYDYYSVVFESVWDSSPWYYVYFGEHNEYYVQVTDSNKINKSGRYIFRGRVYDDEYKYSFYTLEEIEKINHGTLEYLSSFLGSSSFGVISGDECYYPLVNKLELLCLDVVYTFGICSGDYHFDPGFVSIYINDEKELQTAMNEAVALIEKTSYDDKAIHFSSNGVTQQEIIATYEKLDSASKTATVKKYELEFLLESFTNEDNSNGYYPDELYNDYRTSVENAKIVMAKENMTNDECNQAYWNLLYNFNRLCLVNTNSYDVNFDGIVNIMDATEYQRVLAKLVPINSSIDIVTNFDDLAATTIQNYLVKNDFEVYYVNYVQSKINDFVEKQECFNIESEKFDFSAWKVNEIYHRERTLGRC